MTNSSEELVRLEDKATRSRRNSRHRSRHRNKITARVLLVLAVVIGILAITNFAYNAFMHANCAAGPNTNWLGIRFSEKDCNEHGGPVDGPLRYDAAAAVVAAALLIGSFEISRRIPKQRAMTTSPQNLVDEPKTVQSQQSLRHRPRHRKRVSARFVLALGLLIGGLAVSDFAYNAYRRTDCLPGAEFDESGIRIPAPVPSGECITELADRDERLRLDATLAAFAVAFLIGSMVVLRRIKRHRR